MNRREFIKSIMMACGVAVVPFPIEVVAPVGRGLTIAQICSVSYPSVLKAMKAKNNWVSLDMSALEKAGVVKRVALGPTVEIDGKTYPVEQAFVPLTWTEQDEEMNHTENDKIELASQLLQNGLKSLDDVMVERIGTGKALVSNTYRYDATPVCKLNDAPAYWMGLYTCAAFTSSRTLADVE